MPGEGTLGRRFGVMLLLSLLAVGCAGTDAVPGDAGGLQDEVVVERSPAGPGDPVGASPVDQLPLPAG